MLLLSRCFVYYLNFICWFDSTELLNEEHVEDRLVKRSLQKGLLLEFKKDSDKILLAVAQRPDGKKNWMVSDQVFVETA